MKLAVTINLILLYSMLQAQLSPGDLAKVHEKYEGLDNCNLCHSSELGIDPDKCLKCHEPLTKRIRSGKSLHANSDYKNCQTCHVDHLGKDNELIWWKNGKKNFDHKLTGYSLVSAHKKPACKDCHQQKNIPDKQQLIKFEKDLDRTYLGLDPECLTCHLDEHQGRVSNDCISCHLMDGWKPATNFDHNKAKFRLTGAHVKTSCAKCHSVPSTDKKKAVFQFTGIDFKRCIDCHTDPHTNRFGSSCTNCHTTSNWKARVGKNFNHALTRYPLQGAHLSVKCDQCHKPGRPVKPLPFKKCIDCHNDYHQRQFLTNNIVTDCKECHTLKGFSPSEYTIDQHQKTAFRLVGAHLATPCVSCHSPVRLKHSRSRALTLNFTFSRLACITCHENIHGDISGKYMQNSECFACHNEESWDEIRFDHNRTKFKLTGKHETAQCSKCHQKEYAGNELKLNFQGLSSGCYTCHEDIHDGQFTLEGQIDCARCHVTQDWLAEKFDHNRDSKFEIKGGHVNVSCGSCHKPDPESGKKVVRYKPLKSDCSACHELRENKKG